MSETAELRIIDNATFTKVMQQHWIWLCHREHAGQFASFANCDLSGLDLSFRNLSGISFAGSRLCNTDFTGSELHFADFDGADMLGAKLCNAKLLGAKIANAKNFPDFQRVPKNGSFIAYKKVVGNRDGRHYILELEIPADAKRVSSTGSKCRANKAKVLRAMYRDGSLLNTEGMCSTYIRIVDMPNKHTPGIVCRKEKAYWDNGLPHGQLCSIFDNFFFYEIGREYTIDNFSDDIRVECQPGIHFFMSFEEAVAYSY